MPFPCACQGKVFFSACHALSRGACKSPTFFEYFDLAQIITFQEAKMVKIDSFLARELPGHFLGPLEASLGGRRGDLKRTFPRQAERKNASQAHTKSMIRPFPRQAGGKGNRKRTPCSHDCLFLDRQGGKGIASAHRVHEHLVSGASSFFVFPTLLKSTLF